MKFLKCMFVALTVGTFASTGAADSPAMVAASAFANSIGYPMQLKLCAKAVPDRKKEFKKAFDTWSRAHATLIAKGKQLIVLEGLQTNTNTVAMITDTKKWLYADFPKKPLPEQISQCNEFLKEMQTGE